MINAGSGILLICCGSILGGLALILITMGMKDLFP